jgi:hypothetical protein
MFNVLKKATFTHDVPIMVPIDGGFEEQTLKTTFNYLDSEEVKQFDVATASGTTAFLSAVVNAFHDLTTGANDAALPYSIEVRDALFRKQYIRQGVIAYYFEAVTKVKEGN